MSQKKVDMYKQEKYNRKHAKKKNHVKKVLSYVAATLVALAFVVYIGYSVAVTTGLYTPPSTSAQSNWSDAEVESLRNTLIQKGDTNVKGNTETPAATEAPENSTK